MTIKNRIKAAKQQATKTQQIIPTRFIESKNHYRSAFSTLSINDQTKQYQTILTITDKKFSIEDVTFNVIDATCQLNNGNMEPCKGNSQTICRHTMAALIKANDLKNKTVTFFDNFSDALQLSNFGGNLVKVQSTQGKRHHGWIVIQAKKQVLIDTPVRYEVNPSYTNSDLVNEWDYPSLTKGLKEYRIY